MDFDTARLLGFGNLADQIDRQQAVLKACAGDDDIFGQVEAPLEDAGGVVARAAERLRVRRTTLVEKMRKYGMNRREDELDE